MSASNKRLERLREVVHAEPSVEGWTRLCEVVDEMKDDELVVAREYLEIHLASWPGELRWHKCRQLKKWIEEPPRWWFAVASLHFDSGQVEDEGAKALANSPYLANLTSIALGYNDIGFEGAKALANSPYLTNLTTIALDYNGIGIEGAKALASSTALTTLFLGDKKIGEEGVKMLAKHPHINNFSRYE